MWLLGVVTVDRLAVHTVQPASASTAGSTFNFKVPGQIIAIKAVPIPQQLAPQQLAQMQMLHGTGIQPSAMLPAMPLQSLGQPPPVVMQPRAQPQPGPFYAQPQ
jgi:hypothetical protein